MTTAKPASPVSTKKESLDAIARALHPDWSDDARKTYSPGALADMVIALQASLAAETTLVTTYRQRFGDLVDIDASPDGVYELAYVGKRISDFIEKLTASQEEVQRFEAMYDGDQERTTARRQWMIDAMDLDSGPGFEALLMVLCAQYKQRAIDLADARAIAGVWHKRFKSQYPSGADHDADAATIAKWSQS